MATIEKRILDNGTTVFRVKIRTRGHKAHSKTFSRMTDAKQYVRQVETAIDEGKFYRQLEGKKRTLAEAIDRFIAEGRLRPKCESQQLTQLKWWKKNAGHMFIADFSSATFFDIRAIFFQEKDRRGNIRQSNTLNRYRAPLSRVFKACLQWRWLDVHPLIGVEKEREPRGRDRFLSEDEIARLLEACDRSPCPALKCIVVLALSTGMRRDEVRYLKWSDVDLKAGAIIVQETKNGDRKRVAVRGKALELLKEHSKVRYAYSDYVFVGKYSRNYGNPLDHRGFFNAAVKDAKIENFRFHDLRHSCASYLAMNKASDKEIQEVLGLKTVQMTKRYAHLRDSHVASVVEDMNRKMFGS